MVMMFDLIYTPPWLVKGGGNMHGYEQPERRLCVHMPLPLLNPILIIEERTWKYDLSPKFFGSVHEMWFPRMLAKGSLLVIG